MTDLLERLRSALAGRYAIEAEIGRGGMATVYLAEDRKHRRKVAIKVLHPELAAALGPGRFLREIQIAAHLEHTHILALIDSGEADGLPYYVMPYVEGESLRERLLHEGPLPVREALGIAAEVADGLDYAHQQGVVHRDIKPGNILLSAGHARVADFGIARAVGAASEGDATATGLAVGTPKYMSPEQAAGGEVDGRADVYALGCVLWEMLVGEPPFDGPTPAAILARKVAGGTPEPKATGRPLPADLEGVLARAMAPEPDDRFQTAGELAAALKEPGLAGGRSRRQRYFGRVANAALAIVLLVAGVWLARVFSDGPAGDEQPVLEIDPNLLAVLPFQVTGTSEELQTLGRSMPVFFQFAVTGEYGPRAVDAGAVMELWRTAGGTAETPLPEATALEIAQTVGAGRLVHGVVAGSEEAMSLTATLLEVPSGDVRVGRTRIEGPTADYESLVEDLITRLLTSDQGFAPEFSAERLRQLTDHDPLAVQAALRGLELAGQYDWPGAGELFDEALAIDSTFLLAAYWKFQFGEQDWNAARLVWEHRDELSPRDRALVHGLMGSAFRATRTMAQKVAAYDSAGVQDWETDLPITLQRWGSLAEIPRWRERVKTACEHLSQLVSQAVMANQCLFELAAEDGDTAAMRRHAAELALVAKTHQASATALAASLRVALLDDDRRAVDSLWQKADAVADSAEDVLEPFLGLLLDGRGLAGLDRFLLTEAAQRSDGLLTTGGVLTLLSWARARGRYAEWSAVRDRKFEQNGPEAGNPFWVPTLRLRDALILGEPEDSAVLAAAAWVDSVATGAIEMPAPVLRSFARCWDTLWKAAHGDTRGARETVRHLREDVDDPDVFAHCTRFIDVYVAGSEGRDLPAAVARLDSLMRPYWTPGASGKFLMHSRVMPSLAPVGNLFLSRVLVQAGDTAAALRAARRGKPREAFSVEITGGILIDHLREEARLAAMVGDTTGAVDAYQLYFTLRDVRPDHPPWAAQWDSMRVEYANLTGVESP